MGYLYMIIATLMWSFVGIMVKKAGGMVDSSVITMCRFLFGAIFLVCFLRLKGKKPQLTWRNQWIWIGVVGKIANYVFENAAITMGFAYGNVVIWPVQAVFLAVVAAVFFKERMNVQKVIAVLFCVAGVFFISWKGLPFQDFGSKDLISLIFYILAAFGAGIFIISQKKLIDSIDSINMNLSIFLLASLLTAIPLPFTFSAPAQINVLAVGSLIGLGVVTGASFYLNAEALKRIPLLTAVTIGNSSVIFTFLWAWLFFKESINLYMITGAVIMVLGLILINIPERLSFNHRMEANTKEDKQDGEG